MESSRLSLLRLDTTTPTYCSSTSEVLLSEACGDIPYIPMTPTWSNFRFMYKNAGHLRKPTVFLFTEAEIKDEVGCFLVDNQSSNNSLSSRERRLRDHANGLHERCCYIWQKLRFSIGRRQLVVP